MLTQRSVQRGNRPQHFPAIAKDHTEVFQVLIGEIAKD